MTVDGVGAFLALIFLLLPAVTFRVTAARVRSRPNESEFTESLYALVVGLLIACTVLLILGLLRAAAPSFYPDPTRFIADPHKYFESNYGIVVRTAGQFIVLSNMLAFVCGRYGRTVWRALERRNSPPHATPQDIWTTFMIDRRPANAAIYLAVLTDADAVVTGKLAAIEVLESGPTVVLDGKIHIAHRGSAAVPLGDPWQFYAIRDESIKSIAFSYVDTSG